MLVKYSYLKLILIRISQGPGNIRRNEALTINVPTPLSLH